MTRHNVVFQTAWPKQLFVRAFVTFKPFFNFSAFFLLYVLTWGCFDLLPLYELNLTFCSIQLFILFVLCICVQQVTIRHTVCVVLMVNLIALILFPPFYIRRSFSKPHFARTINRVSPIEQFKLRIDTLCKSV